jgi:hypothetical protein
LNKYLIENSGAYVVEIAPEVFVLRDLLEEGACLAHVEEVDGFQEHEYAEQHLNAAPAKERN